VNEIVKRARLAKVNAYIISNLRNEMPSLFGKEKAQQKLLEELNREFNKVHRQFQLPVGDFPEVNSFREKLRTYDFTKFAKLNQKLIDSMDQVLADDIPKLLKQFQQEVNPHLNPFEESSNPFDETPDLVGEDSRSRAIQIFQTLQPVDGKVTGKAVRDVFVSTGLPRETLSKIWNLSDRDKDGLLTQDEFVTANWLVDQSLGGFPIPETLPQEMLKSQSKANLTKSNPNNTPLDPRMGFVDMEPSSI